MLCWKKNVGEFLRSWKQTTALLAVGAAVWTSGQLPAQAALKTDAPAGFFVGAAIDENRLIPGRPGYESAYDSTASSEFNLLVAENSFKPFNVWSDDRSYSWDKINPLLDYAKARGIKIRAHTLVWYYSVPWFFTSSSRTYTNAQVSTLLKDYITAVIQHCNTRYPGGIQTWDVLNEAVDDSTNNRPYNLRNDFWYQRLGPDYPKLIFQWAREADPNAKLYYNDYGAEGMNWKSNSVYSLVTSLRNPANNVNGKPIIDGVGWQSHEAPFASGWRAYSDYYQNAQRLKDAGLEFMVTEGQFPIPNPVNTNKLNAQAQSYFDLVSLCRNMSNCRGFVVWGLTDKYVWIPSTATNHTAPLLFDGNYAKKPAYYKFSDALKTPGPSGGYANSLLKNGDFELDNSDSVAPVFWRGWSESGTGHGASYTETTGGGQSGSYHLTHYKTTPYEIITLQNVNNVPNGLYTFSAYVKTNIAANSGSTVKLVVKNYGGSEVLSYIPPQANSTGWTLVTTPQFNVTQNKIEVQFSSNAGAYQWTYFDNARISPVTTATNLASNPGFEAEQFSTQTPSGWSEWSNQGGVGSGYTESSNGSKSGNYHGTHWNSTAYNMYTSQTKTGLANGLYTARVWAKRGGNQSSCFLEAKDYGGASRTASIPTGTQTGAYQLVEIKDINVTNGQCTFGIWTVSTGGYGNGSWVYFDDVEFFKQ